MRKRSLMIAAFGSLAVLASGCGSSKPSGPDATVYNYDFSCMGNALPATTPATIKVSGVTQEIYSDQGVATLRMLPDGALTACQMSVSPDMCTSSSMNYGTAMSGSDGSWAFNPDPATNSAPLDVYLYVQKTGDRTTYLWPNSQLYADNIGVKVPVMLNAFVAELSALAIQQSPQKAIVGLDLVDCQNQPVVDVANVMITLKLNGQDLGSLSLIDAHAFNDAFAGDFFLLNVPPGDIEASATWKGKPFRSHHIITTAGTTSETKLAPGYLPN